jgi:hypothetical protein
VDFSVRLFEWARLWMKRRNSAKELRPAVKSLTAVRKAG